MELLAEPQEKLFRCEPASPPPRGRRLVVMLLAGAAIGALAWLKYDRSLDWHHMAAWVGGGMAALELLDILLLGNPTLAISIGPDGLTEIRKRGRRTFLWKQIEAARFQDYPVVNMHTSVRVFLLRAAGENFELTPGFDDATEQAFTQAIEQELSERGIPETAPGLPSFERVLSLSGAWVFVASIAGILIAHAMGYRTLGTVFGLGLLFTGTVLAMMTSHQRLSKVVLSATVILILGTATILWACKVNLRDTLNKWEQVEKETHRGV